MKKTLKVDILRFLLTLLVIYLAISGRIPEWAMWLYMLQQIQGFVFKIPLK
jgi:hypothetical protein